MKKFLIFATVVLMALLAACGQDNSDPDELVMGFVPSQDSDTIVETVEPLADELSEILGRDVEPTTMTSYNALVEGMGSGTVHIGFIPAFGYVMAHDDYDVEVILKSVRHGDESYQAQYLVRQDSGIETLADLEGKTWAYADAASTSGFLFPASQLMDEFSIETQADLTSNWFGGANAVGAHDTAALEVYEGDADVATTFDDVRDNLEDDYPDIFDVLTVIDYTDHIPNDTISVIPELNDDLVDEIREAFLSFNEDEDMIQIMNDVYTWDAIVEAEHSEYEVVAETYDRFRDEISLD
ncbi:phosphate/phosphite/phosphonate ABC transporter substrate-binding protein [Alkalibacillus haloalkaliphilus]|uniref:phosphate/phosphite/phosphonate ABC transporter substrate-binding protein n=1 Tax=Alkalibacillus haloalkaliphilus TaxID=94136 RepID=UPI002935BFEC|nr:phosphate/phosphite/phosphonate ABC transporter substrate-binding protein [Alkalibacillus haloalkaliphilus]MDV2583176.1 phosphate/phosphite/phosphonate ABC transporter substrate-binding protein [Alkalibacillus haloalkaliphilus]